LAKTETACLLVNLFTIQHSLWGYDMVQVLENCKSG